MAASSSLTSSCGRLHLSPEEADRLVNRLKNTNLEKFHTLCKMHLSFLLHLPGSSLEEFLGDGSSVSGGSTPGTPNTSEKSRLNFSRHFGRKKANKENKCSEPVPITQAMIDQLLPLLEYLSNESNLSQEGLFRKSGHIGRQKLLREKLQQGEDVRLELNSGVYSAHDCASTLKAFLSELSEPLLTERHYFPHCQIPEMEQEPKQLQTLQLLLQLLPAENLFLLRYILSLLHKVATEGSNKMTSETLGTLFAPHLLVPRKMSASELQSVAGDLTKTVAFMIDNATELFKLPQPLIRDIATYWTQMEECTDQQKEVIPRPEEELDSTSKIRYRRRVNPIDIPIQTSVAFADRQASQKLAAHTDTQIALAQLYAHVSSMPESTKKRRLLKQFNKANSVAMTSSPVSVVHDKHKRTKSFGDSIKKMVSRNHRRRCSGHALQLPHPDDTPFSLKTGTYTCTTPATQKIDKETHEEAGQHENPGIQGCDGRAPDTVRNPKRIQIKLLQNMKIQNKMIQDKLLQNKRIQDKLLQNKRIQKDIAEGSSKAETSQESSANQPHSGSKHQRTDQPPLLIRENRPLFYSLRRRNSVESAATITSSSSDSQLKSKGIDDSSACCCICGGESCKNLDHKPLVHCRSRSFRIRLGRVTPLNNP